MRIACLTRYDGLGASSRVRFMQYHGALVRLIPGLVIEQQPLLSATYLERKYAGRGVFAATVRSYACRVASRGLGLAPDLWWIEKELWPFVPATIELTLLRRRPYVLDLDDAIFHNYDQHPSRVVRRLYGTKIDRLMAGAALVAAGNEYLAARARAAGARWVEVLPTVIDLDRYPAPRLRAAGAPAGVVTVGWIGSPATAHYLAQIAEPLARLARERRVRLVVVGGGPVDLPGLDVTTVPWTEATEVESIAGFDIGVMPLADSPWERGKCGYKLIQYMACGVPVVASPVGVNTAIVSEGVNGFLATTPDDWHAALAKLAGDAALRARLGHKGRERVEADYCVQVTVPRLAQWLLAVAAHEAR